MSSGVETASANALIDGQYDTMSLTVLFSMLEIYRHYSLKATLICKFLLHV